MESNGAEKIPGINEAEGSETTIEIKIKTLDSQIYSLRVDKQVPVPALKEQIASVTGVLSEQQRLICRGRVLKDDQLLSAYHVEDGHTLHLVVRQPVPTSSDGTHSLPGTSHSPGSQLPPSVVIETFNVPDRGDGVPLEINQIVSAVLGSFGFSNLGSGGNMIDLREHALQRHERMSVDSGSPDSTQQPPEQGDVRVQPNRPQSAFGIPTAISLGTLAPPVIPDSVTTLNLYLSQLRRDIDANVRVGGNNAQAASVETTGERDSNLSSHSGNLREGLPTLASLAEVLLSTRQFLIDHTAECLQLLGGHLESQTNVNDSSVRVSSQSSAWRTGLLMHNLGAYLLELGRTIMTLRFGQTPSETVINTGPAVFISPSGPNPLMVQPLPSFGAIPLGPVQPPGSGLANGHGAGPHPRRIDIQIRRGSNANQEERGNAQQTPQQGSPITAPGTVNLGSQTTLRSSESSSVTGESGVRVLPIRSMVAAMPAPFGRLPSDSSGNPVGLYYPVLGRFQHVPTGHVSGERGQQASSAHHPAATQPEQPSGLGSAPQQNVENTPRNGSLLNSNSRRRDPSRPRSVNVSILSARGTLNSQDSERQIRSGVFQFLRNIFPGGDVHVDDPSLQGTASGSITDHAAVPVTNHTAVPIADCAADPVADCAADHAADPVAVPIADCAADPVADHTVAPVADCAAAPVMDCAAAPVADCPVAPVGDCAAASVNDCPAAAVTDHTAASIMDLAAVPIADSTASAVVDGTAASVANGAATSNGPSVAETNATDEGIFLSNLLHQIIPVISQHTSAEPIVAAAEEANTSEHEMAQDSSAHAGCSSVGSSRRQIDSEPNPPNPKRQKME